MLTLGGCLFEVGGLLNFHHFHKVVILFWNKTMNKNKFQKCTKAEFKHDIAVGTFS